MRVPAAISDRPHRFLIPGVAWLTYLIGFGPLHGLFGTHADIFAFIPLVLTAWHWGSAAGLVAGLAALGATLMLSALVIGTSLTSWLSTPGLLGTAAFVLIGYAVGRLRDLHALRDAEVDQRLQVETALREREARLRLVNDITKKIRTDESLGAIIRAVVEGVGCYFPDFETSYATADLHGINTVCTRRSPSDTDTTLRRFEAPVSQDYLDWLTGKRVLAIEDVSTDTLQGVHLDTLVSAGARAYLSAPIPHGEGVIGLLSIHVNDTHRWTEKEKAIVRDAADVLAVALEDAVRKQHLLESEEKFRMLAEHSAMNISLVQRDGIVYANPTMQQMTGYSEAELRELDFNEVLVAPEHRSLALEWATRRFEGERLDTPLELKMVTKDGRERWIAFRGATIELAGKVTLLTSGVDVTEAKQAEELLLDSESRLRAVLDQLGDGVTVEAHDRLVYVNPTLCRMFGYEANELLDADPFDFLGVADQEEARAAMRRHASGDLAVGEPRQFDAARKDGSRIPVEAITRRIEYAGSPALLTTIRDLTRRNRAEAELHEQEERMQILLEHHPDGVLLIVDGKIAYANPAICKMSGYPPEDLVGKDPLITVTSRDYDGALAKQRLSAAARGDAPLPTEYHSVKRDGSTIPVEVVASPPIQYRGSRAVFVTIRDLTERRRAEQVVREAETKYRSLVENSLVGVYIVQDQRFVYCNPQMTEIFGYSQDELLALPSMLAVVAEDDKPTVVDKVRERLDGVSRSAHYRVRIYRKDGTLRHIEVRGARTEVDGVPAILGTVLDITEQVEQDRAVRASEERFRTLFEQAPIGIVVAKPDTRFVQVNAAFCDMLGYSETELIGRSFVDVTHREDLGGTTESARRVLENAESIVRFNKRYVRKDGTTVQAETTVSLVRNSRGELLYALAMIEDVSQRRHLEHQLEQMQRLESVGQLAGGVAHNFNNALTAIYGYSELLARRFDADDPAQKDLEQIKRVAEQSASLTRQLLAFSRKEQVRLSAFPLNALVAEARDMLAPILGDRIELVTRLDDALPDVRSDRGQMEQVITNLVLNARDAMPDGGTLTVETQAATVDGSFALEHPEAHPGRYARLTVTDTGLGMDEDTASRVFEPFFTTKEQGKGVGLGLAMVHGAVTQSGGFVTVTSAVGAGSSFSVYLPQYRDVEMESRGARVDASATE